MEPGRAPEDEHRVDRQQVTEELDIERDRHREERDDPREKNPVGTLDSRTLESEASHRADQRRQAQQRARPPQHQLAEVVQELWNSDVLVGVGDQPGVPDYLALFEDIAQVRTPLEQRVRLAHGERHKCTTGGGRQAAQRAAETPVAPPTQECGHDQREEERQGAELRGHGKAYRDTRAREGAFPAALGDPEHEGESQQNEEGERHIVGGEVRVLDVQHRNGKQEPREEPGRPAKQPPAEKHEQEHRGRAPERRERAADEDRGIVRGEPGVEVRKRGGNELGHVQRERAIGKEVRVELERAQRELGDRLGDPALVGVEVMGLVEVQAEEADGEGEDHQGEEEPAEPGGDELHRPPISRGAWPSPPRLRRVRAPFRSLPARAGSDRRGSPTARSV